MHVFPSINVKWSLVWFVSDAISYSSTEHHLVAAHVIIHDIFKIWHESNLVDEIEIDEGVRCDLNSNISFDIINESPDTYCMIKFPLCTLCHFVFNSFEKVDTAWASADHCLSPQQNHITQVFVDDFFIFEVGNIIWVNDECITLSIEKIDLIFFLWIEWLVWKIL